MYTYQTDAHYNHGYSELNLSNELRKLWEQHATWTRAAIVSLVFGLPDVDFVSARLLQNPEDFGNVFAAYYGDKVGSRFRDLLNEHLVIAADLVNAAKAGDNKSAAEIEKRWYANGDEMAAFLASINPYWSEDDWRMMFHTHLDLVKAELVSLLTQDYSAEVSVYDELEAQALEMADIMTQGFINQFPKEFRN